MKQFLPQDAAGGVVGGVLSDNFSRYSPYLFGFGIVAVGLIVQALIWFAFKQKPQQIASYSWLVGWFLVGVIEQGPEERAI